jgi:hypothetical protein
MKKIITHLSPHLDEIFSIWAIKRFDPDWVEFEVSFKATNPQGGEVDLEAVDKDPDTIYLGLGRGRFDEHVLPGEKKLTAASLVWEDLKKRGLTPKDAVELQAVERLLDFVVKDDLGELNSEPHFLANFSIVALWDGFSKFHRGDSDKKLEYGLPLMDYMKTYLIGIVNAERALESGREFETPWGEGIAVEADYKETAKVAYRKGYVLVVIITPKLGYHLVLADTKSSVDLTNAYHKAEKLDPDSDWYLHQSKRMLISGSHSAPNVRISKLSLNQMISLVKK